MAKTRHLGARQERTETSPKVQYRHIPALGCEEESCGQVLVCALRLVPKTHD